MEFWRAFTRWVAGGLSRFIGIQYPGPAGYTNAATKPISFDAAMQLSAVWACVKLLAETVASLDFTIYRKTAEGREVDTEHPLSILFAGKVNRYQNRIEFFESLILNLVMHGNAYCAIARTGDRITSLMPLMTAQVETTLMPDGSIAYTYTETTGVRVFAERSIWHIKLMGNGIIGLSVLDYARDTLNIAKGAEQAVTKVYANGATPSGILMIDRNLTPEQRTAVRTQFKGLAEDTGERLFVLEHNMKYQSVSMSPQDIELLASRQFNIEEICRWFGVPSVLVNHTAQTTWGTGISQIVEGFYKLTLRPLIEKVELSFLSSLFMPTERAIYEPEFGFDDLLRLDQKARLETYAVGINNGVMTPNEARAEEGWAPMDGGDRLMVQGAIVPITMAGNGRVPTPPPA